MMPETCPSCGGYMTVEKVLGTVVVSELKDRRKKTTKYAFTSYEGSEGELCPSCRRAAKRQEKVSIEDSRPVPAPGASAEAVPGD